MGTVISMEEFQKAKKKALRSKQGGGTTDQPIEEVVKRIGEMLIKSVELMESMRFKRTVLEREQAVTQSTLLLQAAHTLAQEHNLRITREEDTYLISRR